jgi:hypothetical protein
MSDTHFNMVLTLSLYAIFHRTFGRTLVVRTAALDRTSQLQPVIIQPITRLAE